MSYRALEKTDNHINISLISSRKCMLWVLISEYPQHMYHKEIRKLSTHKDKNISRAMA